MATTTVQRLIEFLESYSAKYDKILNAVQAKLDAKTVDAALFQAEATALREAVEQKTADAQGFQAEAAALRDRVATLEEALKESEAFSEELEEVIERFLPAEPVAEIPAPVTPVEIPAEVEEAASENDPANPTQAQDELVGFIEADPATETEGIPVDTVGTPEPTPTDVVADVLVAEAEAIEAEIAAAVTPAPVAEPIAPEQPAAPVEPGTVTFSVGGENAPAL